MAILLMEEFPFFTVGVHLSSLAHFSWNPIEGAYSERPRRNYLKPLASYIDIFLS
jgi:hypothetical protein